MADDMANNWGCRLVFDTGISRGSKRSAEAMTMDTTEDNASFISLYDQLSRDLSGKFLLEKVTPNGTDANLFAVSSVTNGDNNGCLVACGCYVSGDGGPLASWTTSSFSIEGGPSFVVLPKDVGSDFTREHTVALPYHIPGAPGTTTKTLRKYEDACLDDLHVRCLVQKMKGVPITALLLELILANNGATLSDRALIRLGQLAAHHGFSLICDEIMTGGRTGRMLLCLGKPEVFVNAIACITMGKWLGMGLVLVSPKHRDRMSELSKCIPRRGPSTHIKCDQALKFWNAAMGRMKRTEVRRAQALKKLNCPEEDAWGEGLHIFAPVSRVAATRASKVRYLPLLEDTPFDSIRVLRSNLVWTKEFVNNTVTNGCYEWLGLHYLTSDEDKAFHKFALYIVLNFAPKQVVSLKEVEEGVLGGGKHNTKSTGGVLSMAEAAGLVTRTQWTKRRLRRWIIEGHAIAPWSQ